MAFVRLSRPSWQPNTTESRGRRERSRGSPPAVPKVAVALCAEAQKEEAAHTQEAARWAVVRSQEEAAAQAEFWWAEAREEEAVPAPADRLAQPVTAITYTCTCTCSAGA